MRVFYIVKGISTPNQDDAIKKILKNLNKTTKLEIYQENSNDGKLVFDITYQTDNYRYYIQELLNLFSVKFDRVYIIGMIMLSKIQYLFGHNTFNEIYVKTDTNSKDFMELFSKNNENNIHKIEQIFKYIDEIIKYDVDNR